MHHTLPILFALAGCASITSGQRAETLGKGRFELAVESSYRADIERDALIGFPLIGVAGRVGVSDRVDLGARVGSAGVGASSRIALRRGAAVSLAIAPSIDLVHARDQGIGFDTVETALPLLASYRLSPGLELLASPRLHSSLLRVEWSDTSTVHTFGVGSGFGAAFRVERAWVIPELGLLWPFVITGHPADEMGGTTTRLDRVVAQLSLTVLFGGGR